MIGELKRYAIPFCNMIGWNHSQSRRLVFYLKTLHCREERPVTGVLPKNAALS